MSILTRIKRVFCHPPPTTGQAGERLAADHLESQGYRIAARNLRLRHGEIDLVADPPDHHAWVVVEVKCSDSPRDGFPPYLRVNHRKQRKLTALAASLQRQRRYAGRPIRFDIVSVSLHSNAPPTVRHIPAAFEVRG